MRHPSENTEISIFRKRYETYLQKVYETITLSSQCCPQKPVLMANYVFV